MADDKPHDPEQGGGGKKIKRLATRLSMSTPDATNSRGPASGKQLRLEPKASNPPTSPSRKSETQNVRSLKAFYDRISDSEQILTVVGGGTAALTYLATADIDPKYTHVVVLGGQGFWANNITHNLAQPPHILALPHQESAAFVDPREHDKSKAILSDHAASAYESAVDYQARLLQLKEWVVDSLQKQGKRVHFEEDVTVNNIFKRGSLYGLKTNRSDEHFFSGKIVIATGAGPGRTLQRGLLPKDTSSANAIEDRILNYSDVLNETTAERIRDKTVFIYGGGPTAAWAMEVATKIGKSSVWVGKDFNAAAGAGPRVKDIIDTTGESRAKGRIESISWQATDPASDDPRIVVNIIQNNENGSFEKRAFSVDYLVRCTGQDVYEKGGLHDVLSLDIKNDLVPIFDHNQVSGKPESVLAFGTKNKDLEIIGAAAAAYYDIDRGLKSGPAVSESLPTGGRIGATIGGVVSSVSALTNYMPISQNPKSGDIAVTGLNLNVMNATQLAVCFTGAYPEAAASKINKAVQNLLAERSKTPFGLSDEHLHKFEASHFGETGRQRSADLTGVAREVDNATETGRSRDRDRDRGQSRGR